MLYWIGRVLCKLVYIVFGRFSVTGCENVPQKGGVILAPNHVSYSDPPCVGCGIRRQVHYMAKKELFDVPVLGFLIRAVGAFPVKRGTADRTAIRRALELLEQGKVLCLFPEGTRSQDGNLQQAESGIGMIALKSRAPVVPVALIGTEKLLPPHSFFFRFSRVRVIYGSPMTFEDLYERGVDRDAIDEVGRRVIAAIAELKEKAASGEG